MLRSRHDWVLYLEETSHRPQDGFKQYESWKEFKAFIVYLPYKKKKDFYECICKYEYEKNYWCTVHTLCGLPTAMQGQG